MLTNSVGTNYALNEHEEFDQFGSFTLPPKTMPYLSDPAGLVNQTEIPTELSC